jgi:hypothetical protein
MQARQAKDEQSTMTPTDSHEKEERTPSQQQQIQATLYQSTEDGSTTHSMYARRALKCYEFLTSEVRILVRQHELKRVMKYSMA